MKYRSIALSVAFTALILLTGCISTPQNAEFVKTVNFSSLDTFNFKRTMVIGMEFRKSEELLLERLSEETIVSELEKRDFVQVAGQGDFFVVVKWKKAVSSHPDPFEHIDPYHQVMARRDNPTRAFAPRLHLTLEIYESDSGNLFWRRNLTNIFDAIQLTEERVIRSLRKAIENFPQHIEKDPNLPNIE